ncbi:MAG: hypothetical protein LBH44_06240 [Treponema sp.]|jgi:hypothetical protein|nr:hypothetical protein [Treponema sp.]
MKKTKYTVMSAMLLIFSCANTGAGNNNNIDPSLFKGIDAAAHNGNYQEAVNDFDANKNKLYTMNSVILYELDAGILNHYAGNHDASIEFLREAERHIEEAYTKSISKREASGFAGDNLLEYESEDFEDIYVNLFNALNYYHKDKIESAVVEARRINEKLAFLENKYSVSSKEMQARAGQGDNIDYVSSKFANSALGRYLGVLFHRASGNENGVRVDYDWLKAAFNNAPEIYDFPIPSTASGEIAVPRGMARLNVIGFSGLSPVKKAAVVQQQLYDEGNYVSAAVSVLEPRPSLVNRIEIKFDNGQTVKLEKLENLEAVYNETYKKKFNLVLIRTLLRNSIMKTGLNLDKVDVRSSRFFPAWAWVTGINLNPGTYSFVINYYDSGNQVIHSVKMDNVDVKEGRLNLAEAYCLK